MRRASLFFLVVPFLLSPLSAQADEASVAKAKQRFQQGAQAYREARYKDAISLFLEANSLDAHPELIYNVGQAYEKLGDVPNALRCYREYLRLSPGAPDRATIEASIRNLEARLRERGVQQVSVYSTPAGATLILDQKSVGQTPWTGEIAPGRHIAIFKATGYPDTAKEFVLTSDRAMDLDVALAQGGGAGSGATTVVVKPTEGTTPPTTPPPAEEPPKRSVSPWTIAALSLGVASLGGALGAELARKSAESAAMGDPTQVGFRSALDSMHTRQTVARALVGVGAAVTVVGGVLLVVDLRPRGSSGAQKAGLGCFDSGCGAFVTGRF